MCVFNSNLRYIMDIIELEGLDGALYQWVGPLVMNPKVLKQNYNFPFRTTEKFRWYIAVEQETVIGFIPVERKTYTWIINNYYVEGRNEEVLVTLLAKVMTDAEEAGMAMEAVAFLEDGPLYQKLGFLEEKRWTRYVKMKKDKVEDYGKEDSKKCV